MTRARMLRTVAATAVLALCALEASAQVNREDIGVVLYLADSSAVVGRLASIDATTAVVRTGREVRSVALDDARSVVIVEPKRAGVGALALMSGMYLGAALGALNEEPGGAAYIPGDGEEVYIGWGVGALVGGIVGLLTAPERETVRHELRPLDTAEQAQLMTIARRVLASAPLWQLTLHGGTMPTRVREERVRLHYEAGAREYPSQEFEPAMFRANLAATTLFRRVDLSRTIAPHLDAAGTIVSLTQHGTDGGGVYEAYDGWAALGGVRGRIELAGGGPILRAGIAAGIASMEVEGRSMLLASQMTLAAHGMIEAMIPIGDLLLVGASADYALVPSIEIPASSGVPGSTVNLSSMCVGFAIGVRL